MQYRREIDGLRAVAVLPVILFHAGFSVFSGGYVGVDIFFVISGYLITSILIDEIARSDFSLARFYERRARRLLPALFVVMFACLPFAYMWMLPFQLKDFAQSLVAVVFFTSNALFLSEDGYFATAAEFKPLLHTWSLAVEEQFYLLFPIFLIVIFKLGRTKVFLCLVAVFILSLCLAEWGWQNDPIAKFYLFPTRAWELMAGSICALITWDQAQKSGNFLSAIGLAMILFAMLVYDEGTAFPSLYTLPPVLGAALVIVFAGQGTWVGRLLSLPGFVGLGLISYSAYLWHQPLFAFARLRSVTEPSNSLMAALTALTLLLAWATCHWVEQAFRKRENPMLATQRSVFAVSGAIGAFFVSVGLAGHFGNGFEWRLSVPERQLYSTAVPSPLRDTCHFGRKSRLSDFKFCEYFDGVADVAVYGNSHAVELAYELAKELQMSSRAIAHFSIGACGPGFRIKIKDHCADFYNDRLQYLLNNERLRNVVLTYRADGATAQEADAIVDLANFLKERGKNVVYVVQAPTLPMDIYSYIRRAFLTGAPDIAARPRDEWREVNATVYKALSNLNPNVRVVDLADYFCDPVTCFAIRNNQALYFDDDHMSLFGARLVADRIVGLLD